MSFIEIKPGFTLRACNKCKKAYYADDRNLKRGWGLCCSKKCAASLREKSKPGYDPKRVAENNYRRANWHEPNDRDELGNFEGIGSLPEFNHDEDWGNFSNEN